MSAPKVGFVSLGCPKALVDSERIITQLKIDGYEIAPSYEEAEIVVVNTCGFIDSAKRESLETIGEAIKENGKVIVTGCLGVHENEIRSAHPQVLSITGPQKYEQVVNAVHTHLPVNTTQAPFINLVPAHGLKLTPSHYAYLKISEGCNHKCSFCIIPGMRGRLNSRTVDDVLKEAEGLVNAGVKEILVISQDTSAYGTDIKYKKGNWGGKTYKTDLLGLCEGLGSLGIWIRLHYVYPYPHVDQIIPLMAQGKILPYLDIPFQHGSPEILRQMRRPAAVENNLDRINAWRDVCPGIVIRSTFIVGFPGESEEDFELLLEFIEEARLDRVGCFKYSPVAGAQANDLPGHVCEELKQNRWDRFMQVQAQISKEKLERWTGKTMEVMIDCLEDNEYIGRSFADAPEIDGVVIVKSEMDLQPGDIVTVKINNAGDYDLWGSTGSEEKNIN